jgi:hypothetical protein
MNREVKIGECQLYQVFGEELERMGFKHAYELKGGIKNGWIKAGKKTVIHNYSLIFI